MKNNENNENEEITQVVAKTPFGDIEFDYVELERARVHAKKLVNISKPTLFRKMVIDFLGEDTISDNNYWKGNLGPLMKLYIDEYMREWKLVKEFILVNEQENECHYGNVSLGELGLQRFLSLGYRFYESTDGSNSKFVLQFTIDCDGDQRLTVTGSETGKRPLDFIAELEADFYLNGPLKNAFFDMDFNFIDRDKNINELVAWDKDIRNTLKRDLIDFQDVMPILAKRGLPNSRGIILSGPPGTGKTMYAKSIAAECHLSTILISSEMIRNSHDVKSTFRLARKLAPSLIIVEDIDTAGTVSRQFANHPILGEYLQAMDGLESNDGVIVLATTNHTENIDPAISDRPGRFDRIIEVGLPKQTQRREIIEILLRKYPVAKITKTTVNHLVKHSSELSGAWIREIVQSALILAISQQRNEIMNSDLIESIGDVLNRRGLPYKLTPVLNGKSSNPQVCYQ
jgi:adenylate kinase family enzyme